MNEPDRFHASGSRAPKGPGNGRATTITGLALVAGMLLLGPRAEAQDVTGGGRDRPPSWHFSGLSLGVGGGSFNPSMGARRNGQPVRIRSGNGEAWFFVNYNHRLNDRWLIGIDAEATLAGTLDPDDLIPQESFLSGLFDGTGSVGLRMQYVYGPRLAGYVRVGWTQISVEDFGFDGVRAAAGLELRLLWGLALRAEVAHDEYASKRVTPELRLRPSATSLRGAVLYRF